MAAPNDNDNLKHDPDYYVPSETDANKKNIEENARSSTVKKISDIIEKEFVKEIDSKKAEVFNIFNTLTKATKIMHYLRHAIVTDYYNKGKLDDDHPDSQRQTRPHPTVNAPKRKVPFEDMDDQYTCLDELGIIGESKRPKLHEGLESLEKGYQLDLERDQARINKDNETKTKSQDKEASKEVIDVPSSVSSNYKTRKRIIVGNISKWIAPEFREKSNVTHKWTIYVRDIEKSDLTSILSKVRFFLHSSYRPNDVIDVTTSPFHLSRLGWGEFPVRVQLHFANGINKPVDIIHQLKLDQTYTGLQTLGMETVVDIWLTTKKISTTLNIEDNFDKDIFTNCDNNETESNLMLLLRKRHSQSTDENITIHHDLPTDHDYLNINQRCDDGDSNQLMPQKQNQEQNNVFSENCTKINNINDSLENENSNGASQVLLPINTINIQENNVTIKSEFQTHNYASNFSNSVITLKPKPQSKRALKEESIETLVSSLNSINIKNLPNLLRNVALLTPMITEQASDPHYKSLHPYASESYAAFQEHRIPKQRAMERQRAICALDIISRSNHQTDNLDVQDFITWARRYGYTPILESSRRRKQSSTEENILKPENTTTYEDEVQEWLVNLESSSLADEDDEEIDVLALPSTSHRPSYKSSISDPPSEPVKVLEQPTTRLQEYARNVAEARGHELPVQELEPGIAHASASFILGWATERLVDELLRLSLVTAFDRSSKSETECLVIEPDDVRAALLKREEFQILTNYGLGSED